MAPQNVGHLPTDGDDPAKCNSLLEATTSGPLAHSSCNKHGRFSGSQSVPSGNQTWQAGKSH